MTTKKYFRILSFALIVSSTLMIVANNVPYIGSFRWLWGPLSLLSFIVVYPKIITHIMSKSTLLYGVIFAGVLQYLLWDFASDWYKETVLEDFYNLVIFVWLVVYFITAREFVFWGRLAKWGLFFFMITAIMTLVATQIAPTIVRESYSGGKDSFEGFQALQNLGFGSYGFSISLVALIPALIFFIKSKSKTFISKKLLWVFLGLVLITLIQMQIFANILIALLMIVLSFVNSKSRKMTFFFTTGSLLIFSLIPTTTYADLLTNVSSLFSKDSNVYYKMNDLANYLVSSNTGTGVESRIERYPGLISALLEQPFLGDASYDSRFQKEMTAGAHLFWMSRLALWGVFGFIGYLLILKNVFKPLLSFFDKDFRYFYSLSLTSVIFLGLIKSLTPREPYVMLLIIIPGLYFLTKTKLIMKKKPLNK